MAKRLGRQLFERSGGATPKRGKNDEASAGHPVTGCLNHPFHGLKAESETPWNGSEDGRPQVE